ncbi:MAG: glycoside hydrolase family 3 N-terminal domain-containing protein [Clostridia bacterium]
MKKVFLLTLVMFCVAFSISGCGFINQPNLVLPSEENTPITDTGSAVNSIQEDVEQNIGENNPVDDTTQVALTFQQRAKKILQNMTLEEKVGQMFFARCPEKAAAEKALEYHLGGYVLFSEDFQDKTRRQVISDIKGYQNAAKIPLLIGVDEEGGSINRLSLYRAFRAVPFWSPQDLYKEGGWNLIISDTEEKSTLLKSLGININLAPVCDVSTDSSDFIHDRTFGQAAAQTSEYVKRVVETMNSMKMGSVLKHFPGYGNNIDTHTGISYDKRSYESFVASDFLPFAAGIKAGAGAVLVSHNIVAFMDSENPASLSPEVHRILREELGFEGVIMTDDLYMDAIRQFTGEKKAAVIAVLAGNDLLVCTDFEVQIPAVLAAVQDGTITENQIETAVTRILLWKLELGITE